MKKSELRQMIREELLKETTPIVLAYNSSSNKKSLYVLRTLFTKMKQLDFSEDEFEILAKDAQLKRITDAFLERASEIFWEMETPS